MKKKFMLGLLCLFSLVTVVNAEELSEPLASIIQDGTVFVDAKRPQNEEELNATGAILYQQYNEYFQDDETSHDKNMTLIDCNEDYSVCTLNYHSCIVEENNVVGCGFDPVQVNVEWKEETVVEEGIEEEETEEESEENVEEYSEEFKKLAPNNTIEFNAIAPTTDEELDFYSNNYFLNMFPNPNYEASAYLSECNEDMSECTLDLTTYDENRVAKNESHKVKLVWKEADSEIKAQVDSNIKSFLEKFSLENAEYLVLYDLHKISYMNSLKAKESIHDDNLAINYVKAIKTYFGDSNFTYYLDLRMGDMLPMNEYGYGGFTIAYDGVIYGLIDDNIGMSHRNVIYIPDETEDTKEAYIAAAKKRIDEYLGHTNTKIEAAGLLSEYKEFDFTVLGDVSKMGDHYYNVTIGENTEQFVILRDSSKIEVPIHATEDVETNISISSESSEVPLDTTIKVTVIEKTSDLFKEVAETLQVENVQIYDLKLWSNSENKYISKLANGEFKVRIPIAEALKDKNITAYYISDDKEIEEHPVTIVDDYAEFTTDHFSVYALAEVIEGTIEGPVDEEIPPTFDGAMSYVIIGMIGLIGLGTAGILLKKKSYK